jgi:hypothetical protein
MKGHREMVELLLERTPEFEADLARDFRPYEVVEGDFTYTVVVDGRLRIIHRRQRKVRYVGSDQNSIREVVNDLGAATGETSYVIPCSNEVEMAQAFELFDLARRKHLELVRRRAWVKPLRDAAFRQAIAVSNEEVGRRSRGASSFGRFQRIQRESPARDGGDQ